MRRVQPSTIVEYIDAAFPELVHVSGTTDIPYDRVAHLKVLLKVLDDLDEAFLPAEQRLLVEFLIGVEQIRNHVHVWDVQGSGAVGHLRGDRNRPNPVFAIREILRFHCKEVAVPDVTPELQFIDDSNYRGRLREDVSSAESSFEDGQFKASTVLAGSVAEALLLFEIQRRPAPDIDLAVQDLKLAPKALDERPLGDLLKIARGLKLFSDETLRAAELAKDFRNLIHPGREQRKTTTCTRGTARAALAAMDLLIHECTARRRT